MEAIKILQLMVTSAVLAAWGMFWYYSEKAYKKAAIDLIKFTAEQRKNMIQVQLVHNEQANELVKVVRKVEELSNRLELANMLGAKKPFKEDRKG